MRFNGYQGKPVPAVFLRALSILGTEPATTLFIDDQLSYIKGYQAMGGAGLLLDETNAHPDHNPRIRELSELTRYLDSFPPSVYT
jgi:FMN phosphatase YigB (HAD superfamily)